MELLGFMAAHRFVLSDHVRTLLGVSAAAAYARLRMLCGAGYVTQDRQLHAAPGWYQISRAGLGVIGSSLPKPRAVDLRCHRHDIGLGWLWLAARDGAFGPVREVISERHLRSHDGRHQARADRYGVRLGGVGPGGRERLHYPDLILEMGSGHRMAVELELSSKSRRRREGILAGYGADARIDAVVYLVDSPAVGRAVMNSASRLGLSSLIHVQRARFGDGERAGEHAPAFQPSRRSDRAPAAGVTADRAR